MESTLVAMTKKKRRVRMRESTADEWIEIVNKAETERFEYCSTVTEEVADEEEEESEDQKIQESEKHAPAVINRWNKRNKASQKSINTLVEIVPAGVNKMEEFHEWEEIEMAVTVERQRQSLEKTW